MNILIYCTIFDMLIMVVNIFNDKKYLCNNILQHLILHLCSINKWSTVTMKHIVMEPEFRIGRGRVVAGGRFRIVF